MSLEGELRVDVTWDGAHVTVVKVRSTRPHVVARLVRGQRTEAAVSLVSGLYAVCRGAHGAVAATACDLAGRGTVAPDLLLARSRAVDVEAIQEHCTRLGLHWSQALGGSALVALVREVRAILSPLLHDGAPTARQTDASIRAVAQLAEAAVFGMSPAAWLNLGSAADLVTWSDHVRVAPARWWADLTRDFAGLGCCDIDLMPEVDADALETIIAPSLRNSAAFAQRPDWKGRPVETGPLARTRGHPLVAAALREYGNSVATRLVARLTDLAVLLERDEGTAPSLIGCASNGAGYAGGFTARGLLVHRAVVRDDVVDDYSIVAPTEWNFHPHGVFAAALADCSPASEASLLRDAEVLTQAIDPCLPCSVELHRA